MTPIIHPNFSSHERFAPIVDVGIANNEFFGFRIGENESRYGARPLAGQDVTVKQGGTTTQRKTNTYGQLPAIPHLSPGEQVELWIRNAANELEKVDSFVLGHASHAFTYFTDFFSAQASTRPHIPAGAREKKKPAPFSYVVQPGDTVGKIALKFKTSAGKIQQDNHLKNWDKIFPGQRLNINGSSPAPNTQPAASNNERGEKQIHIVAIPARSKERQGQPMAIIPSDQKRAPWMEIAVREAKQWAGKKEKVITKTDNYHKEIGLGGNLGSTPWCASFVNYCLKESGHPHERSASSQFPIRSKKFIKLDSPVYGCIAVFRNPEPKKDANGNIYYLGHVGFIYGKTNDDDLILLGGNQGDSISFNPVRKVYEEILKYILIGYFIPKTYTPYAHSILKNSGDLASYNII